MEYAVQDSSFWLSKCYLRLLRGHEADVVPVHSSIDFPWILSVTEFDLWSILGNSLTSFEAKSSLLRLNDRLIKDLVSQVWSNCRIPDNFQQVDVLFVTSLLRLACLVCMSVSYYTTLPDWILKCFKTRWQNWAAFKTHKKCGRRDFPSRLCYSLCGVAPPQPGHKNPTSYAG